MKKIVLGFSAALIAFSSLVSAAATRSKKDGAYYSYCKDVTKVADTPKDCPGFH